MATATWLSQPTNTTVTTFRAWGKALSDVLKAQSANGLVQTADTGQIDWAAVAVPGAINTAMGYEVYRFDDALQASAPIFIKIEYGSGAVVANPSLWFTVGAATNGAGTLSGLLNARTQMYTVAAVAADYKSYLCILPNKSGFVMVLWPGGGVSYSRFFLCERSCNPSGTPDGGAVASMLKTTANTTTYFAVTPNGTKTVTTTASPVVTLPTSAMTWSGVAPVYPPLAVCPGYSWQLRTAVAAHTTDLGAIETTFTVPGGGYGTFLQTTHSPMDALTTNTNSHLAIAWR